MIEFPFEAETKAGEPATIITRYGRLLLGYVRTANKVHLYFWNSAGRVLSRTMQPAEGPLRKHSLVMSPELYDALYN